MDKSLITKSFVDAVIAHKENGVSADDLFEAAKISSYRHYLSTDEMEQFISNIFSLQAGQMVSKRCEQSLSEAIDTIKNGFVVNVSRIGK